MPVRTAASDGAADHPQRPTHPEGFLARQPLTPPEGELIQHAARGGTTGLSTWGGPLRLTRRRRNRAALVLGPVLLVVGVVVIATVYSVNATPRTEFVPAQGAWEFSPSTLTGLTAHVHWFGGDVASKVYMVWGKPDCVIPSGVVGVATGANGSFHVPLDPGTKYYLFACANQAPEAMNFSVSLLGGLTLGEVAAGFTIGVGAGFLAIGLRGRLIVEHPRPGAG